jgi:hypothetical protein
MRIGALALEIDNRAVGKSAARVPPALILKHIYARWCNVRCRVAIPATWWRWVSGITRRSRENYKGIPTAESPALRNDLGRSVSQNLVIRPGKES